MATRLGEAEGNARQEQGLLACAVKGALPDGARVVAVPVGQEIRTCKEYQVDRVEKESGVQPYRKVGRARRPTPRDIWRQQCPVYMLRFEENMTQAELATVAGMHQTTVSAIEHNRCPFDATMVQRIAAVFNADSQELYVKTMRWGAMEPTISAKENDLAMRRTLRKYSPILRRCKRAGISVRQICQQLNMSTATLYSYASDPTCATVRLGALANIARILECSFERLCKDLLEWQEWFGKLGPDEVVVEGLIYEEKLAEEGRW